MKYIKPENSPNFVQAIAEDRAIKVEWPDGEVSFSSYPDTATRDAALSNLTSGLGFFAVKASAAKKWLTDVPMFGGSKLICSLTLTIPLSIV